MQCTFCRADANWLLDTAEHEGKDMVPYCHKHLIEKALAIRKELKQRDANADKT